MWRGSSSSTRGGHAPTSGRHGDSSSDDEEYKKQLAEAVVSDAARKRGAHKYTNMGRTPPPRFSYSAVAELKRKRAERRRRLASTTDAGSYSGVGSSASAHRFLTPKREQTGAELVLHGGPTSGRTIGPEDFVGEGEEDTVFNLMLARSAREEEEKQKSRLEAEALDKNLLAQGLALAAEFEEKKASWDRVRTEQDAKFVDLDPED